MENQAVVYAVILAAGTSSRMQTSVKKQRLLLEGKSVLLRSVLAFAAVPEIAGIIVVCREEDMAFAQEECRNIRIPISFVIGGSTRQESAKIGFSALPQDASFVAIHDAARCLVTPDAVSLCLKKALTCGAAVLVGAIDDTVKTVENGRICKTTDRERQRLAQTPQIFRCDLYGKALENAAACGLTVTDDSSLLEAAGCDVFTVENKDYNPKITKTEDLILAEAVLKVRKEHE